MPGPGEAVRARGVSFRSLLVQLERRGGRPLVERVLAGIGGEVEHALRTGAVVANAWYPVGWYDALLASAEREGAGARALVHEGVAHDFRTIFKVVSLVVSPKSALTNAVKVMARYWDGGRVAVPDARDGLVRFVFDGYVGFTPRAWEGVAGGIEAVLALLGAQQVSVDVRPATGGARCEITARYAF